ncbi:hypothetical protein V6N13_123553 [Hibiscus sabdariffa]|uniref:Uncharacterized protein n=1 Tax=Hibiscus sabdariffa TaxID=183260 RepID=A0ABR2QTW2_9ROSI
MRRMASSITARGVAATVGVGPKLGRSIAHKFAHERYTVAILARDLGRLSRFADEIAREEKAQVFVIRIDCPDSKSIREAFEGVLSLGFGEVLVYNAYYQPVSWNPTSFTTLKPIPWRNLLLFPSSMLFFALNRYQYNFLSNQVEINIHSPYQLFYLTGSDQWKVLSGMVKRRRGTILFTGRSTLLYDIAGFSELCNFFSY